LTEFESSPTHHCQSDEECPGKDDVDVQDEGFFEDGDVAIPLNLPSPSAGIPQLCVDPPESRPPATVHISDALGWERQEECGATASTNDSISQANWEAAELVRLWIGAWNCQGKTVSQKDLDTLLPPPAERGKYNLYVLGTFACGRSTQSSLINASKEKWEPKS
jgi:hypothetical protein